MRMLFVTCSCEFHSSRRKLVLFISKASKTARASCIFFFFSSRIFSFSFVYMQTNLSLIQGEGTMLATGSYDGQARIWGTNGKQMIVFLVFLFHLIYDSCLLFCIILEVFRTYILCGIFAQVN